MLREGINYECVRSAAAALYHVVRLLEMSKMRTVDFGEIEEAGARWAKEHDLHRQGSLEKGAFAPSREEPGAGFDFTDISQRPHMNEALLAHG
jgi:hypothetical protein